MTKSGKLLIIVGVMFFFIIVLVALLIYANTMISTNNKAAADTTVSSNTSISEPVDSTLKSSEQSPSSSSPIKDTVDLNLYFFDADNYDSPKEIRTVSVDNKLYQDDITAAINQVLLSTNLKINKATLNGNSITVDLSKEMQLNFNGGSASGITYTNILAATITNLPNIDKLEVTVDGKSGVEADHFNFNGTFSRAENSKKYTFTESNK